MESKGQELEIPEEERNYTSCFAWCGNRMFACLPKISVEILIPTVMVFEVGVFRR